MAKGKTKGAAPKAAAAKKPGKKEAPKKTLAKEAPETEGTPAFPSIFGEHPEGLFNRLTAMRDEMDHLFNSLTRSFGFPEMRLPAIGMPRPEGITDVRFEVAESDKSLDVTAELPGLGAEDIQITLSEGTLTVKGEKRDEREKKGKDYYVSERRYGAFSRTFRVPETVKEDKISASFENGVLSIKLPKAAKSKRKPKSIKVAA